MRRNFDGNCGYMVLAGWAMRGNARTARRPFYERVRGFLGLF
jgi:hypothetical protein